MLTKFYNTHPLWCKWNDWWWRWGNRSWYHTAWSAVIDDLHQFISLRLRPGPRSDISRRPLVNSRTVRTHMSRRSDARNIIFLINPAGLQPLGRCCRRWKGFVSVLQHNVAPRPVPLCNEREHCLQFLGTTFPPPSVLFRFAAFFQPWQWGGANFDPSGGRTRDSMAEKSGMIFGNVLNPGSGKFGRDLVGEWRPPARYVAAAGRGGCSMTPALLRTICPMCSKVP